MVTSNPTMEMKECRTMAQIQALRMNSEYGLGTRRSKRRENGQNVKTNRLRRIRELFWDDDNIYAKDSSSQASSTESDSSEESEKKLSHHERKRKRCFNYGQRLQLERIHESPHIYTIDNFIKESEMKHLQNKICQAETKSLFNQSFVDKSHGRKLHPKQDEVEEQRTSTFIHFSKLSDSRIASIENRAAELLCLPIHSIEPLQLVRYEKGQYFRDHHDLGVLYEDGSVELPKKNHLSPPRRIITILVYLNDLDHNSGGSTCFPLLREENDGESCDGKSRNGNANPFRIYPKRGMAVIWCNIKNDGSPDERLVHSGEPLHETKLSTQDDKQQGSIIPSLKYALNIWACEE